MFKAILIEKTEQGQVSHIANLTEDRLPEGDVDVDVIYSTLNYKDGLAITGKGPIVRSFPMVPGIDLVGVVRESKSPSFRPGDQVLLNGWGVGEGHWGGLSQRAKLKGEWLIPLPAKISSSCAMMLGTAGYTAMLCVLALEKHGIVPGSGDVLVTGANGGVGTIAIMLLKALGYRVVAATGRMQEADHLKSIGATEVIDRNTLSGVGRPLQKERWIAAIDSVGSHTLANICAGTKSEGAIAACGMAQGLDFPGSVAPFILRGITLYGINSVTRPKVERIIAWDRLASLIQEAELGATTVLIGMADVPSFAEKLIRGEIRGRVVVDVNK